MFLYEGRSYCLKVCNCRLSHRREKPITSNHRKLPQIEWHQGKRPSISIGQTVHLSKKSEEKNSPLPIKGNKERFVPLCWQIKSNHFLSMFCLFSSELWSSMLEWKRMGRRERRWKGKTGGKTKKQVPSFIPDSMAADACPLASW